VQRELIDVALFTYSYNREGRKKKKKRGGKLTWCWGSWRPDWWRTVQLKVVRPAACSGRSWKKKERSLAKEKGSSWLEMLEWLRRELLSWFAFGKDKSFWEMWLLLLLLLLLLLPRSQWQRRRFLQRRERSGATTTCDGLMATWGGDDGEKTNDDGGGGWRPRRREKEEKGLVFGQLYVRFSSPSGHQLSLYL